MGGQGSSGTLRAIQDRVESFVQPMAEHEVQTVDVETRTTLRPRSAKALITLVFLATIGVGAMLGLRLMSGGEQAQLEAWEGLAPATGSEPMEPDGASSESTEGSETDSGSGRDSAGPMVVSVQGMVKAPGLLRVDAGTRVGEAIDAAGGYVPGGNIVGINLAAKVTDGMQIVVDDKGSSVIEGAAVATGGGAMSGAATAASAAGSDSGANSSGGGAESAGKGSAGNGLVNLNTADETLLQTLQGVGPATAQAIISWRDANGRFASVEQLMEVKGIGPAKFEAMKGSVTVG